MIDRFEHKGLWFLPSNVDRKIHGILKYDYEKNINTLELIGSFYDYSNHEGEDIILGITTDGNYITLTDCYFKSSTGIAREKFKKKLKRNADVLPTLNFEIKLILKGYHIFEKEGLVFQKVYVEIFNLHEWVGISGLQTDSDYGENTKTILYNTPEPIKAKINEDLSLEIKFNSNNPFESPFTKELKLRQQTILLLQSKKHRTLNELIYLLKKFNYFLSASIQKPLRIESMELYSENCTLRIDDNHKVPKPINAYQILDPNLKFEKRKQNWEMLFTYDDIKDNFEIMMQNWFNNYEKFEAPFNLVLSQFYISEYYLENLFINIAQAAESFHRKLELVDDTPKSEQDKEFDEKVKRVLDVTPDNLKNWVKSRISNKPKHFYDTRLKYLFKEFSNDELNNIIGDYEVFIKSVVKSRNYYTHYNKEQKKDAAQGIELVQLYQKLRLLLLCGFLIESGFDNILLEKLIKEKSKKVFNYLLN
jgi:hypothetical protein